MIKYFVSFKTETGYGNCYLSNDYPYFTEELFCNFKKVIEGRWNISNVCILNVIKLEG